MDESTVEKKGLRRLCSRSMEPKIAAIKSKQEIIPQVAYMHSNGVTALFSFYPMPDMHDSHALTIAPTSTRAASRCRIATIT